VESLRLDEERLAAMSRAAAPICDGLGTRRIVLMLAPERSSDGAAISLRPASENDSKTIFAWQTTPGVRSHFHEPRPPSRSEHEAWFAASLTNSARLINIIEADGLGVGVLRLDRYSAGPGAQSRGYLVSILVAPEFAGRRIAQAALRAARRLVPKAALIAEISDTNIPSCRAFEACGYRRRDGIYVNDATAHA
jgi:RimJ/RimL family protein N-acetyltransferase